MPGRRFYIVRGTQAYLMCTHKLDKSYREYVFHNYLTTNHDGFYRYQHFVSILIFCPLVVLQLHYTDACLSTKDLANSTLAWFTSSVFFISEKPLF